MKLGPGTLIAAAFIGPGTVTVCTLSGFNFGYEQLWVLLVAGITTIVFQNMAARIGFTTKQGISEVVASNLQKSIPRLFGFTLIIAAIFVGNAAYEAGNIAGGALGIEILIDDSWSYQDLNLVNLLIGFIAFVLLYLGSYKAIEKILIGVVIAMASCFFLTSLLLLPPLLDILKGLFLPTIRGDEILSVIALVGTTVVPYNLFLHASIVNEAKNKSLTLRDIQRDTILSISLGVVISMSIIIVAAAVRETGLEVTKAADLAKGIETILGKAGQILVACGLLAAGITSAVTAPLAAGYAISGLFSQSKTVFRYTWMTVLVVGICFSTIGYRSITIIKVAQIANGLLLPIIAFYLFWIVNKKSIMNEQVNSRIQNIMAGVVLVVVSVLSVKTFMSLFL